MPDAPSPPFGPLSPKNLLNAMLVLVVMAPSAWFFTSVVQGCGDAPPLPWWTVPTSARALCGYAQHNPLATLNAMFFVNVCVLFWLINLLQRSTWLIDPYWTLLPPLMALFFRLHPRASFDSLRSTLIFVVVGAWSLRLTHSYFRREEWRFGWREDWRFAKFRQRSRHWWWQSFFVAYAVQQVMLVGLALPIYAAHRSARAFWWIDAVAAVACATGIVVAAFADTQLRRFTDENRRRRAAGAEPVAILRTGLWRLSRHPNYFGEQLFWWGLALFGGAVGAWWTIVGTAFNSAILARVTVMTERRMERADRRDAWLAYKRVTSVWIPWPPRATERDES